VNKHRLLAQDSVGHYIALLAAIRNHPEDGDCDLVHRMDAAHLPAGFAQDRLMDIVELLKTKKCCAPDRLAALYLWIKKLPEPKPKTLDRIAKLSTP